MGLLLLIGFCWSCSMEEVIEPVRPVMPDGEQLPDSVYFILEEPTPQSRVTYADAIHSDFETEDIVGCFVLNDENEVVEDTKKNARYRVSVHTNVDTGKDRRFLAPVSDEDNVPRNNDYKYLFYYPYDKNVEDLTDLRAYNHVVLADQNQREKYEASDLLWDICEPDQELNCVFVKMDHAMSNVIVEVSPSLIKEGTVPTLLRRPKGVKSLNLVRESLAEMDDNLNDESYLLEEDEQDIIMWEFGRANSGNFMFRAIVPSNHIISPGTTILSLVNTEGNTVRYKTSMNMSTISFLPGRNYYLNIVEAHDYVAPEIGDDETWVYDVLDPETGQPVGLLCREYLHFQPGKGTFDADVNTGTPHPSESDVQTKYITSQAWVFYKLKGDGITPNLKYGYVLKFIYDVVWGNPQSENGLWPDPYTGIPWGGLFTPRHGHTWVKSNDTEQIWDGNIYGTDSKSHTEYGMHGGTIEWDGSNNRILSFTLPDKAITNEEAENGHVAIPINGGEPFLCYHAITDQTPHKVGILSPHYLVDRRVGRQKGVEERLYPLVKIGFNQFWMSRDLRATTQIDGTPLTVFNRLGSVGIDPSDEPGYVFLSIDLKNEDTPKSPYTSYDPFNQLGPEERERYKVAPMYNFMTLEGSGMLSKSSYSMAQYHIPQRADIASMLTYVGWRFCTKIVTRDIRIRINANNRQYKESEYDAHLHGKYLDVGSSTNLNVYTANICGLDLRPEGVYESSKFNQPGLRSGLMVLDPKTNNSSGEYLFCFTHEHVLSTPNSVDAMLTDPNQFIPVQMTDERTKYFAPLRFFLKFTGQEDNSGSASGSSVANALKSLAAETKAPSAEPFVSRDVYVGLETVETEE